MWMKLGRMDCFVNLLPANHLVSHAVCVSLHKTHSQVFMNAFTLCQLSFPGVSGHPQTLSPSAFFFSFFFLFLSFVFFFPRLLPEAFDCRVGCPKRRGAGGCLQGDAFGEKKPLGHLLPAVPWIAWKKYRTQG
uniref:Macaca fascicularis brain cDNA clone: QccE-18496, similar to human glycine-, glutamate-,thienylcyclohexylpiperidine-binding protein (KIAA0562), mRNA, RefSeq: XM_375682.1 n=1 Tax=Macaca fascicularis TaxID=9541 RepID=I7GHQ7_MACFA|nr:unnamed protein product [Macaca fascicularis]